MFESDFCGNFSKAACAAVSPLFPCKNSIIFVLSIFNIKIMLFFMKIIYRNKKEGMLY